jgi:hypothetical protein
MQARERVGKHEDAESAEDMGELIFFQHAHILYGISIVIFKSALRVGTREAYIPINDLRTETLPPIIFTTLFHMVQHRLR